GSVPLRAAPERRAWLSRAELDAGALRGRAGDAHVKVIVVRQRVVGLEQQRRGARADSLRRARACGVGEQARAHLVGYEDSADFHRAIAEPGFDERPVLRVVEANAGQTACSSVRFDLRVARRKEGLAAVDQVKTDVHVAPAFVRVMSGDVTATALRQI